MTFLNSIFDDIYFGVERNIFNRLVKDMQPSVTKKTDDGYLLVINALGVDKEDIKISLKKDMRLEVKGETDLKDINYKNNINMLFDLSNMEGTVDKLKWYVKNGLLYISIITKPFVSDINIEYEE